VTDKTVLSDSLLVTQFIELPTESKISFEIFLEETQAKNIVLSAGQRICGEPGGSADNIRLIADTQFHNFETRTIKPGLWTQFESSVELASVELGDQSGVFIRVLDGGKFRIRQLKITNTLTGDVNQLLP
ncbi:MAG TPA: hypothetical protein PK011_18125, partial [Marinagarivorans sp.]|nr:hypothetical protein [Marinagarivorans sp.]